MSDYTSIDQVPIQPFTPIKLTTKPLSKGAKRYVKYLDTPEVKKAMLKFQHQKSESDTRTSLHGLFRKLKS